MIKLDKVTKKYGSVTALDNLSLNIDRGDFVAITGRSGSGKSTLLYTVGMLENIDGGDIFYNGLNYKELTENTKAEFRNSKFGFIFQAFNLEPAFTVAENVQTPLLIAGVEKIKRTEIVKQKLASVDLDGRYNEKVANLSGGEKQRVATARALAGNPDIILADEPCGNLDKHNGDAIMLMLRNLAASGITVILVTHNVTDAQKADRIIELVDGKIVSDIDNRLRLTDNG